MSRPAGIPSCRAVPGRSLTVVLAALLLIAFAALPAAAIAASPTPAPNITIVVKITPVQTPVALPTKTVAPAGTSLVPVRAATIRPVTPAVTGEAQPGETPRSLVVVTRLPAEVTGNTPHGAEGEAAEASRDGRGASEAFSGEDTLGGNPEIPVGSESRTYHNLTPEITEDPQVFGGRFFATSEGKQQVFAALRDEDPSVQNIRSGENAVIIEYGKQGMFLGLVPVLYTETVTISPGGEYRADTSWWAAFTEHGTPDGTEEKERMMKRMQVLRVLGTIGKVQNDTALHPAENAK